MLLLEAFCVRTEIPLLVIKTLVKEVSKHKLSQEMEVIAIDALNYLRAEVIYDFVSAFNLQVTQNLLQLVQEYLDTDRFNDAAVII